MAWDLLAIPGAGTIATIAGWATKVVNNFRYLKGIDGVVTIQSGLIIDNSLGTEYLKIPSLTTTQRDALTPAAGMLIYNSTTTQFQKYENGAWRADLAYNSNIASHQISSQAAGDILYANSTSTLTRLGIGTLAQVLRVNAGATAPEWGAQSFTSKLLSHTRVKDTASGDVGYTGYGFQPKALIILACNVSGEWSAGLGDVNLAEMCIYHVFNTTVFYPNTTLIIKIAADIYDTNYQSAVLKTLDADGFTLTWTKNGTGASGNITVMVLALS